MEKHLQVSVLKKNIRPVLLDTLAAMYVACYMFLIICFDLSKSHNDIRFQKVHLFKTKITKTAEKESNKWVGVTVGSVLHYILGCDFRHYEAIL